jgi:hypothetical protein
MMSYGQWTNVFVTPDFTLYISYQTTFFKQKYCEVISKRILIIFAPEEAEIFKDYLFILALSYKCEGVSNFRKKLNI